MDLVKPPSFPFLWYNKSSMKTAKANANKSPEMPFQVDHKLRVDIAKQVTDGIRQAILSGFYKPGDLLPKALDFTRGLHVSIRATQAAYRTLKKEGLISPRRRLGTVVVATRTLQDEGQPSRRLPLHGRPPRARRAHRPPRGRHPHGAGCPRHHRGDQGCEATPLRSNRPHTVRSRPRRRHHCRRPCHLSGLRRRPRNHHARKQLRRRILTPTRR